MQPHKNINKTALLSKFYLRQLENVELTTSNDLVKSITKKAMKQSAVLIPLIIRNDVIHIILTKRCAHLRHHPNQISFPGGKLDTSDNSLRHTALRETYEELAIESKYINVIGELPLHHTMTGFSIKPFIAFVDNKITMKANSNEVSEIIEVPIIDLMNNKDHFSLSIKRSSINMNVYFKPVNGHVIWGATAAMLEQFTLSLLDE